MIAGMAKERKKAKKPRRHQAEPGSWAARLQVQRDKLGMSQAAFAAFLDIPLRTLISWETEQRLPNEYAQRFLVEKFPKI